MKVAISLQGDFVNLLNLNYKGTKIGTRARLNEAIKDEEWLNEGTNRKAVTLTAVRIPVQGLNSMEFMEVHEFLDESAGNLIIPPTEIVAKSGADFDVDKLTTFMPALDKFGKFIESGLSNESLKNIIKQNKGTAEGTALNERVIAKQKAALENRLITTINDILKLPSNYASLVRPNATYLLKDEIADKLEDKVTDYNRFQNYHSEEQRVGKKAKRAISPTRTLEPLYNIHKHEANMVGKSVLGLVALFNALHPVFNSLGAAMPKTYKNTEYDFNLGQMVEKQQDLDSKLFLPHNKTTDGRISLSGIQTQDGDLISELYSQLINGTVDVEKDAWIFFIQGNMELSPMLLMLLKAGVPAGHAVKFLSQPLIREYAKQQRLLGGSYANLVEGADTSKMYVKDKAAVKVLTEFGVKNPIAFVKNKYITAKNFENKSGILNKDGHFDIQILDKILDEPENKSFDDHSIAIFMHFLELENQFSGFQDVIRLANPDTKTSKSIQEVIKRNIALDDLVKNSKIDPALVKGLREESILNTFYDNKIIADLVEPLFKLKNDKFVTKSIIDLVKSKKSAITKAFGKGEDGVSLFMTQFKNGMVNSIFQNYMRNYVNSGNDVLDIPTELLSKYFTDNVFFTESDVSYADDLMALIEKHSGLKDKYSVLQQIASPILKGGEKVLSLNNQKLLVKGNYTEQYYENIKQLADVNVKKVEDTVENKYISDMFKVLPLISLYQNGVGYSKYGFNEILPYEDFVTIMDKASNDFMKTSLNTETMMELFDIVSDPSTRNFKNYLSMTNPFVAQPSISVKREYTPENINKFSLPSNGFFVFGSNNKGVHGLGAAKTAVTEFGAIRGQAIGKQGKAFAIRTKMYQNGALTKYNELTEDNKKIMDKMTVQDLNELRIEATTNPNNKYYVTEIGTKLAGRTVDQMKNFFMRMNSKLGIPNNIILPQVFEVRTTQSSTSVKTEVVIPGVEIKRNAITKEEQLELFNILKPYIEQQGAKTNKATSANVMIGLGLRWDYKSNNPNYKSIEIKNIIVPGSSAKYGYYEVSINGQPLGPINPRIKTLMSKATGIDATDYDGAIINLYTDKTFISAHNDVDEAADAIGYPVLVLNIGGSGNFSVQQTGKYEPTPLNSGDSYVFGINGENRKVMHRTFPSKQDGFLPAITTAIDGETYSEGSYRLSITLRRVKNLEPGMPTVPSKITTQSSTGVDNTKTDIERRRKEALNSIKFLDSDSASGASLYSYKIDGKEFQEMDEWTVRKEINAEYDRQLAGIPATINIKADIKRANEEGSLFDIIGLPGDVAEIDMVNDSIKDTQLDLFNQTPLTFGGKSINEQLEIMNTPEFKSFFAEETIKNPNLDASEALDYYIKCKGL